MQRNRKKSELGRVIARRVLTQMGPEIRDVTVLIGNPRRQSDGTWKCSYCIEGLGKSRVQTAEGADALQALLLAVGGARVSLEKTGNRFSWLDYDLEKAGSGIPRYVPTQYGPRFEARINLAIERESKRYYEGVLKRRKANITEFEAEVKQRREVLAVLEAALERRKAAVADWEIELKKWKPAETRRLPR